MKPEHKLTPEQPFHELLEKYSIGTPLTPDQINFLANHEKTLSNPLLDPVMNYYLKHLHNNVSDAHSFLLPGELLDKVSVEQFKRRLKLILLQNKNARPNIELRMTVPEFEKFNNLAFNELIYYHGNQLLTGAPFIPGGIPQLVVFQWGNYFGVVKYIMTPNDKNSISNLLVYFEDMQDRNIDECVKEYVVHLKAELTASPQKLTPAPELKHEVVQPEPQAQSMFHTPRPTLELSKNPTDKK